MNLLIKPELGYESMNFWRLRSSYADDNQLRIAGYLAEPQKAVESSDQQGDIFIAPVLGDGKQKRLIPPTGNW
jgi:hypothetical protein